MKNLLKKLLKIISVFIVLFLIISVLVTVLVDINQYKDEIAQLVEDNAGLKLEINGDMRLSIVSGIKFKAKDIRLLHDKLLIADIDSLSLGVSLNSLYIAKPEITSVELHVKTLNISRDKKGDYNFLPLLKSSQKSKQSATESGTEADASSSNLLSLEYLFLNDIQLSIDQLHYLDDLDSLSIKLNKVSASLSLLPIIDHHELVIDDPRILVDYAYSGQLEISQARINQYQIANLSLDFNDQKGDFFAEKLAFSFIEEGKNHALPPLTFEADGQLKFKLAYHAPEGSSEPLWTQPDVIKIGEFDFNLPRLQLSDKTYQLKTKQAHLSLKEFAIFKGSRYTLNDWFINALVFDSQHVDLISRAHDGKEQNDYYFNNFRLQLHDFPVIHKGKLLELTSEVFLNKFALKGKFHFSSDSVSSKDQGLKDVKIIIEGKNRLINLSTFSFRAMESVLQGDGHISLQKKTPQWALHIHSKQLNIAPVLALVDTDNEMSGHAAIEARMSGVLQKSDFIIASGKTHVSADNLQISGMDMDKVLENFQNSQSVGLLDVSAVALLGPAGVLVSKGNDYHSLTQSIANKGNSTIKQLNSDLSYDDDILTMNDVAFSTAKHRVAFKGKINAQDRMFINFEVATLDKHGCPVYKEIVTGSLDSPKVKKVNVLVSGVVNPLKSVLSKLTKPLTVRCKEPFYNGKVKPPLN